MDVGWIGLGRLGLPSALLLADRGHRVTGYDMSDRPRRVLARLEAPPAEDGIRELLDRAVLKVADSIADVVAESDVVFVAVQTPHAPAYGGEQPMPDERRDFEYAFLVQAVRDVAAAATQLCKRVTVAVVSTALPGTFNRHLRPLANPWVTLVYCPFFIAMGTTIADLTDPEFVLVGADDPEAAGDLRDVFAAVHSRDVIVTSIESAELAKVAYNTFVSLKIVFGNTLMEISDRTGADCDQVVNVLSAATRRVVSPAYLRGGMGDGGACHPRDLIAMSWLADRLDLSTDLMGYAARAREAQTGWVAGLVARWAEQTGLPVVLLGKAYKPESNLTDGSPALLLAGMLRGQGVEVAHHDPYVGDQPAAFPPAVHVITTRHDCWRLFDFPTGSVVIDPFGYIPDRRGVTVIRLGRKS